MDKLTPKTLFLIDAMALIYRGHFAFINNPRLTSTKLNTSAVFVFANTLYDILNREAPTHMAVAFDVRGPTHRHKLFPKYKATREEIPEDIVVAIPLVERLCAAMNIPVLKAEGWEADDIVGTLTRQAETKGFHTFMVTPDKDYAQLVSEKTFWYRPKHKGGGYDILGVPEILDKWGIERIDQVIDMLGLMGDTSDNIPGISGIGEKTAQKLISQYGSIPNLLAHTDEIKGKLKEKLENGRDMALLSRGLVTIMRDAPVLFSADALAVQSYNEPALKELFSELEFRALALRFFGGDEASLDADIETGALASIGETTHAYRAVITEKEREILLADLLAARSVCFDIETTGLDSRSCEPIGIAFCWQAHKAWYLPLPDAAVERQKILAAFKPFFENDTIEKIGHNIKFDIAVLRWQGIRVNGPVFDTLIASFLTMPHLKRKMDDLSTALLGYRPIPISDLIGDHPKNQISMRDVPLNNLIDYAAEDADVTFQLADIFRRALKEQNQEKAFYEVDSVLIPVLVEMEYEGIALNNGILHELSADLDDTIAKTEKEIFKLAGEVFPLNSPKQLGIILFEKMQLDPRAKKTPKSGQYATNEHILSRLEGKHPIIRQILHYRTFVKLKSTYVDQLPEFVFEKTGRIHTTYDLAASATGRIQSNHPNLQNIPIRSAMGKEVRKAFIARDGAHTLLAADYSQIELRMAAQMSKDPVLINAFQKGADIHTTTAMQLFDVDASSVDRDMRAKAKTVNFSILYGISAFGLSARLNVPRCEAQELIDNYFARYKGVRAYLDAILAFAHTHEYVETITGRRRYLRDINSKNQTTRKGAERVAINAPIQGSAADLIKIAMRKIHDAFHEKRVRARLLLQVHDELVFDVPIDELARVSEIVKDCMVNAISMDVPLVVDMGNGPNWLDAH